MAINYSGLWKFTAKIKAGDRGKKSSSIVWNGTKVFADAKAAALAWMSYLSDTFGSLAVLGGAGISATLQEARGQVAPHSGCT